MSLSELVVPVLLCFTACYALGKRVDVYTALTRGALAVGSELMATYGPDSYIGRVAAVMLGSSETTFYTIAVYFGSVGIVKTRYTIPASLCADAVMFLTSAAAVRVLMG